MEGNMGQGPLEGVKVADFSWYAAGPMIGRYLAIAGAEVVRVESSTRVDGHRTAPPYRDNKPGINRSMVFSGANTGKWGVSLNLRHPKGVEIAKRLVSWSDIAVDNFTPGTMDGMGLGYEELKKVKPDIIMLSSTNQGQTGPHARHPGFGPHLTALSGFAYPTGWPDREPLHIGTPYTDYIAFRHAVCAILAALDYHRRTGIGQFIDLSQMEASLAFLSPIIVDYTANKRVAGRMGNRCPYAAPHGVFPCLGEDRWCAIAVFTDEEWLNFCLVIDRPELIDDSRFVTLQARKQNENELERLVAEWTSSFTAEEVMTRLQMAGVSAGVVKDGKDIFEDPQLRHRHYLWELDHPEVGVAAYDSASFIMSQTPIEVRRPGPCLGEHNEYVYTELLGIPDDEFVQLMAEGVFE